MSATRLNGLLLAVLVLLALVSLTIGPVDIPIPDVAASLLPPEEPASELQRRQHVVVAELRLPRILLAMLVGASLGMAGAAMQGLLRNPLAEPGLLGVSSSASLGAVLCIYTGLFVWNAWVLPLAAMGSAAFATLLLYLVARRGGSNSTLILVGVALSSLAAALTSLAINLAPQATDVQDIVLWLLGSLADRSFQDLRLALPFVLAGFVVLLSCGRELDALTAGEDEAASLGVNLARLRIRAIVGTALCVGASVAVSGAIGFVGLVVPHLLRRFVDYHPGRLLPASALGGAVLLLAADTVLRLLSGEVELMLGVVTALIGAPFFLALVLRRQLEAVP